MSRDQEEVRLHSEERSTKIASSIPLPLRKVTRLLWGLYLCSLLACSRKCKYVTRVVECIYPAVEVSASERMTLLLHLILGKERDVSLIIAAFQAENWQ